MFYREIFHDRLNQGSYNFACDPKRSQLSDLRNNIWKGGWSKDCRIMLSYDPQSYINNLSFDTLFNTGGKRGFVESFLQAMQFK